MLIVYGYVTGNEKDEGRHAYLDGGYHRLSQCVRIRPDVRSGGGGGIRTPGTLRHAGFQDRFFKPLRHPSGTDDVQYR